MLLGTAVFCLAFFPLVHVCLKCVVPGLPDKVSFSPRTYLESQAEYLRNNQAPHPVVKLKHFLLGLCGLHMSPGEREALAVFRSLQEARAQAGWGLCLRVPIFRVVWCLFDLVTFTIVTISLVLPLSRLMLSDRILRGYVVMGLVDSSGLEFSCSVLATVAILILFLREPWHMDPAYYVRIPVRWALGWVLRFLGCSAVSCLLAWLDTRSLSLDLFPTYSGWYRPLLFVSTVMGTANLLSLFWLCELLRTWGRFPFDPITHRMSSCLRKVTYLY
jgi:hypothetical protein